jgi:hypothetical protein
VFIRESVEISSKNFPKDVPETVSDPPLHEHVAERLQVYRPIFVVVFRNDAKTASVTN